MSRKKYGINWDAPPILIAVTVGPVAGVGSNRSCTVNAGWSTCVRVIDSLGTSLCLPGFWNRKGCRRNAGPKNRMWVMGAWLGIYAVLNIVAFQRG